LSETLDYGAFELSQNYSYFGNGLKKSFTGADGVQIGYVYDENNRLISVDIPDVGLVTVNGFEWNSPARVTLPGGSEVDLGYDQLMRLESKVVKEPAESVVLDYGYEYSPTSNIVAKATEHGEYSYSYDELYRLSGAMSPVLDDESFVYDLLGNRLNGGATFDGNNALLSVDEAVFEYDANGNLVRKSVGAEVTVFVYDVADRLVRVEDGSGGVVAEYYYSPFGRRLFKEVEGVRTYFVYSDEGLVGEFDESGVELRGYGFRPSSTWTTNPLFLKVGGEYFLFLNDHLGTPQKIVDSEGNVVWEGVYESFGKARVLVSVVESNLRFAGQYFDFETGLHYNYFRFYDPGTGRYFRVDPIGLQGGMNTYGYVTGNSINSVDPLGLSKYCGQCAPGSNKYDCLIYQHNLCEPVVPGPFFEALAMAFNWLFGTGPEHRDFGAATNQARDMQDAPSVVKARKFYQQKDANSLSCACNMQMDMTGYNVTDYIGKFKQSEFLEATKNLDFTEHFIGSYDINIYGKPDGKVKFVLNNVSSFTSFWEGFPPSWSRNSFGPMGDMEQTIHWEEVFTSYFSFFLMVSHMEHPLF